MIKYTVDEKEGDCLVLIFLLSVENESGMDLLVKKSVMPPVRNVVCFPSEAEVHHSVAMSVRRGGCSKSLCLNHRSLIWGWWLMTNGCA